MILIVDDDAAILSSLALLLKQAGYPTRTASSPDGAKAELQRESFALVLQDMNFSRETSGAEGLALLAWIKAQSPLTPVILITAWGSISLAVEGIKAGASDFVTKPWSNSQILQTIRTALDLSAARKGRETSLTRQELDTRFQLQNLVGTDPSFLAVLELAGRVSATDASVLITGETGTGKELIAEAIHRNSRRRDKPYVKVNLGGIATSLFESEMFGHVKGAFTDAVQSRRGRFEMSDGGTIFLDEIGDLDAACQVKLLRVLQDRTFEVLGSSRTRAVDVRVISATNHNMLQLIETGKMREDLLYRLNLISLHLPALRDRAGDIPVLLEHFLTAVETAYARPKLSVAPGAVAWLVRQPWPGNVRQLRQVVERTVLLAARDVLDRADFELAMQVPSSEYVRDSLPDAGSMTLDEIEKAMILKCLRQYDGHVTRVAEALGLSRPALYRRLEKYGIHT